MNLFTLSILLFWVTYQEDTDDDSDLEYQFQDDYRLGINNKDFDNELA